RSLPNSCQWMHKHTGLKKQPADTETFWASMLIQSWLPLTGRLESRTYFRMAASSASVYLERLQDSAPNNRKKITSTETHRTKKQIQGGGGRLRGARHVLSVATGASR